MQMVINGNETVEHLPCECESLTSHGVAFLDCVLESFNNSQMSKWTYLDGLPQK